MLWFAQQGFSAVHHWYAIELAVLLELQRSSRCARNQVADSEQRARGNPGPLSYPRYLGTLAIGKGMLANQTDFVLLSENWIRSLRSSGIAFRFRFRPARESGPPGLFFVIFKLLA